MSPLPFLATENLSRNVRTTVGIALCDDCRQCRLNKLIDEDTDEIYFTNVACNQAQYQILLVP